MIQALLPGVGPQEMLLIGIIGVLLFGKRLPEVGKSLGKSIAEFKRGMRGFEEEWNAVTRLDAPPASSRRPSGSSASSTPTPSTPAITHDLIDEPDVPKFEPPEATSVPRGDVGSEYDPQAYQD